MLTDFPPTFLTTFCARGVQASSGGWRRKRRDETRMRGGEGEMELGNTRAQARLAPCSPGWEGSSGFLCTAETVTTSRHTGVRTFTRPV